MRRPDYDYNEYDSNSMSAMKYSRPLLHGTGAAVLLSGLLLSGCGDAGAMPNRLSPLSLKSRAISLGTGGWYGFCAIT